MNATPIAYTIEALGWTLLHFLWQGAAVALALWCFLGMARKASPQARYAAGCAALLVMLAAVGVTFGRQLAWAAGEAPPVAPAAPGIPPQSTGEVMLLQAPRAMRDVRPTEAPPAPSVGDGGPADVGPAQSAGQWPVLLLASLHSAVRPWLGWVVGLWAAGVGLLSVRLLACWRAMRVMRSRGREPQGEHAVWIERFARLRQRLGVSRAVRLLCTASTGVPMVIGWLKPVVLVPAGLLTGLSVLQLEAILAHELAHIRRHDYLVNLLQNVMETLFFYHPAVWWVSGQVRREREHCCDDAASAVCGDAVDYARALASLEEWRGAPSALGVSAGGSTLPGRIRRLVGVKHAERRGAGWPVVASVFAACAVAALVIPSGAGRGEEQEIPDAIRITVLDSTGKTPISEFRVIAGVRSRATPEEFTKRTGREVVNWQAHTVRIGKDGSYVWPLEKAYDEMALRVEADGYAPQEWAWAKKAGGAQHVIFKLVEDTGVRGRVLRPDGRPAAAATVALALPQRDVVIEGGRIRGEGEPLPEKPDQRWRRPTLVKAGPDGRFVLPTEIDPAAAVLVVHESGVRELAYAEFREAPEITLERWGRIEGHVLWKDRPGADERITLSIWRDEYGYPGMIGSSAETRTDADGRFTFDKVLPGRAQISRPIGPSEDAEAGAAEFIFDGQFVHAHVQPGDPTAVLLGGRGRTVTGRLIGRETWDDVTFHFHPDAPHIGFPGDDDAWKAFGRLRESAIGPLFFRDKLRPNADGTFEIPHMLPGRYQFFVSAPGVDNYAASRVIKLEPEKLDETPEPLDLGEIKVAAAANDADLAPAETRPEVKVTAEGGAVEQLDTDVLQDALRKAYERNLAKSGKASVQLGRVEGWILAYDDQRSLRRYRAARQARLRIMPDGKVLANPQRESLAIAEDRLTPEDLDGLLASLAADPQTQERPLKKPLREMSVAQQHSALSTAIMSAARPTWEEGGAAVVFRFGDKILQRDFDGPDDPFFQRLHAIMARAYAGGRQGIQRYLEFANAQLAARHPEAPKFDEKDFWGAGFDGDGTGTLAVFFRYEGRDGLAARISVRHRPGVGVYLYEAVFKDDVEDVWGRKHERRGNGGERGAEASNTQPDGAAGGAANVDAGEPKADTSGNEDSLETEAKSVTIRGRAIDAETGEPVFPLITQAGKFDPADPAKVTWGYSEGRSSRRDGRFSTTVRWAQGWTARVLADGYLPAPVLTKAPPAGQDVVEVVLRLKRGRLVRGRVLDHQGQPVKGAAVFAVGPTGLNLAGGKAWSAFGGEDKAAKPIFTDASGRFELPAGEAERLAVSSKTLDAWPAPIPDEGEVVVKLPAPARIDVAYDIEGAAAKGMVFYQLLSHRMPDFRRLECTRELPITGGGTITLAALPPGKYQICRQVRSRVGQVGLGAMLDRQFLELKPGETRTVRFVREKGARLRGKVTWPEGTKLAGVVVSVKREETEKDPFEGREWQTELASDTAAEDGTFRTELVPPGRHLVVAEGYRPLTPEELSRLGEIAPAFRAEVTVDVPATGEVEVPDLRLEKVAD